MEDNGGTTHADPGCEFSDDAAKQKDKDEGDEVKCAKWLGRANISNEWELENDERNHDGEQAERNHCKTKPRIRAVCRAVLPSRTTPERPAAPAFRASDTTPRRDEVKVTRIEGLAIGFGRRCQVKASRKNQRKRSEGSRARWLCFFLKRSISHITPIRNIRYTTI